MPAPKPQYTVVLHEARKQTGLSFLEYAVAESISHLSNQPKYPWCIASREDMASFFDLTRRGLQKIIGRLEDAGFVERNAQDQLRTTAKWTSYTVLDEGGREQSSQGANKVRGGREQSSHNHNNNQLNNNNIVAEHPITLQENSYIEVDGSTDSSILVGSVPAGGVEEAAKIIIGHFNDTYGTRYKINSRSYQKNLEYWLEEYTVDEIKQAITNARYDQYWAPIFKKGGQALELLLRKEKAKTGFGEVEKVDRIGQFLNTKVPVTVRPLTDIEFYQLCKKLNVPPDIVKGRYDFLMEKAGKGEFKNQDDEETVVPALTRWIEKDKSTGEISECNEFEAMDIEDLHPRRMAEIKLFKKQSEFQQVFDKFNHLKKKLEEAPEEEKELVKAQLRDIAPKGKQLQIELGEAKALLKQMREVYGVS